jgi:hypothetical protein
VDRADRRSAWKDVALTAQQLVGENEACDEDLIVSRCAPGLSCADDLCKVGVAPVIEKAAYINRGTWGHVIVAGTDPDDDELKLRESFYNLQDEPVKLYDFEGDPGYSSFEYAMAGDDRGTYLLELATSDTFLDAVKRLRLRVSDSLGANSDEVTADLGAPTQANEGATCDPRGFVECKSGLLCVPSTGDKFACKKGTEVRTAACKAAPVIGPGTTTTHWAGWATHDYWNTPGGFGCEETTNRKEAIVRFKLEQDATRVSISAIRPETKAITALYVLPGCPDTSAAALGCNQATQQPDEKDATLKAHLVLPTAPAVKVPKGEYTVVMEAVMNPRYSIGVEITVE